MHEWRAEVQRRLGSTGLDGAAEGDVVDELVQHLEARYGELRAQGVHVAEARQRVLGELGDGRALARAIRLAVNARPEPLPLGRQSWPGWPGGLWGDIRYSVRSLLRTPAFAGVAILVIGLGIGANTVIFTAVNALLLRTPAGVQAPEELVAVFTSDYSGPRFGSTSYPDYEAIRALQAFQDVAAARPQSFHLSADGWSETVMGEVVSGNYFAMLGAQPAAGRFFGGGDEDPTSVVISHEFWATRLAGARDALGSAILIRGQPFTVVGVAPAEFRGMIRGLRLSVWLHTSAPQAVTGLDLAKRGDRSLTILARLRQGEALAPAQARLDDLALRLHGFHPDFWTDVHDRPRVFTVVPEAEARVPRPMRHAILGGVSLIMVAVLLVLLVACTNLANLMLSRAAVRRGEMGVRMALGASRGRIARHLLTESALLALVGGIVGVTLTLWTTWALRGMHLPAPVALDVVVDGRVLAFAAGVIALTTLLFGVGPALEASRAPSPMLRDDRRHGSGAQLRRALVVFQVAASLVLLSTGGLFLQSVRSLQGRNVGLDVDQVLVVRPETTEDGTTDEQRMRANEILLERVTSLPGVARAALAETVPLSSGFSRRSIHVEGYEAMPGESMEFQFNGVTPAYFATVGIRVVQGRGFSPADGPGTPPVAIVSEAFSRRFWPEGDALGKRIGLSGTDTPAAEVVGVAADARYRTALEAAQPYVYYPYAQRPTPHATLLVRTSGEPAPMAHTLTLEARAARPSGAAPAAITFADHIAASLLPQRLAAWLLGVLGVLAVGIAIIGLYGIVSYGVAQRSHEFGVRLALGATPGQVRRLVAVDALRLVGLGIACGAPAAVLLAMALRQALTIAPLHLPTFLVATGLLGGSTFLAAAIPARRATRGSPLGALRAD